MRFRGGLIVASLLTMAATSALPITSAAAAPAGCRNNSSGITEFCDQHIATPGSKGSIGLLGDSVLLGSASGMSTPSLPTLLSDNGFGPVHLTTSLGMTTYNSASSRRDASAFHWLTRWRNAGFSPDVIVVNLGANHLGTCTPATVSTCRAKISQLLTEISLNFPAAVVWWAKVVHRNYPSGTPSQGMQGWNLALDQLAFQWSNLVVWDWPTALATANPAIATDFAGIHPSSGVQYAKRSALMADHITVTTGGARFDGPRATLPTADSAPLSFAPTTASTIYSTIASGQRFVAGEYRAIDLSGVAAVDDAARAVALTVSVKNPSEAGFITVYRCGDTLPESSNVNFAIGAFRTAQVITRITDTGFICVYSSAPMDLIVSIQGNFLSSPATSLHPISPVRALDTRQTGRAADFTIAIPNPTSKAVSVNMTTTGDSAGGTLTIYACDTAVPTVAHLSFEPNETVAGAAFVPVSASGTICVHVDTPSAALVGVIVDITGQFSADSGGLAFVPVFGTRLLDTRNAIGGWIGRHDGGQILDVVAGPPGAQAATGTITFVSPATSGYLTAFPCGQALPDTSSVNARTGLTVANSITIGLNVADRSLCVFSYSNTHTLFDVVGWWVPASP